MPSRRDPGICSTAQCHNDVWAKGMCRTCYENARRGTDRKLISPGTCITDGCVRNAYARGLCHDHYRLCHRGWIVGKTVVYERHPLSSLWRDYVPEEYEGLGESIGARGVREPIVLFEGKVLDGWHRYRQAKHHGTELKAVTLRPDEDPVSFVVDKNAMRRHLTPHERARSVLDCEEWRREHFPESRRLTIREIAIVADTSTSTVNKAKRQTCRKNETPLPSEDEEKELEYRREARSLRLAEEKKGLAEKVLAVRRRNHELENQLMRLTPPGGKDQLARSFRSDELKLNLPERHEYVRYLESEVIELRTKLAGPTEDDHLEFFDDDEDM